MDSVEGEESGEEVIIDGVTIARVKKFRYLGSVIQEKRDIDEDIN